MNVFSSLQAWLVVVAVIFCLASCQAEQCPDHKTSCRTGQTCCDDKQGGFGCCPYENATCCSDGLHCCPENTQCDLSGGRCRRNGKVIGQVNLLPVSAFQIKDSHDDFGNEIEDTSATLNATLVTDKRECPDHKSTCPSTYTCCADPEGSYACCPFPNGTCCSDRIHCCPHGQECKNSRCE